MWRSLGIEWWECDVGEGEIIYGPPNVWHVVEALEDTVGPSEQVLQVPDGLEAFFQSSWRQSVAEASQLTPEEEDLAFLRVEFGLQARTSEARNFGLQSENISVKDTGRSIIFKIQIPFREILVMLCAPHPGVYVSSAQTLIQAVLNFTGNILTGIPNNARNKILRKVSCYQLDNSVSSGRISCRPDLLA